MKNSTRMTLRLVLLGVALLPVTATAADFSGAWVRDMAQSKPAPYPNYWRTRVAPATGGGNNQPFVITVKQTGQSVQVTHPRQPLRTYVLDGKPRVTPTDTGLAKVTTTAAMAGETLSIATVQPYSGMPGNVPVQASETWALSPDGKTLTITTARDLPAEKQSFTEVYKRQ
jgi:hypothetical protein